MIEAIVCTVCMGVVAGACVLHLNSLGMEHGHCEKWGFAVTAGGAIGSAAEWWLPRGALIHADTLLAIGLALVALSSVRRPFRDWLAQHWDGVDRRKAARHPEEPTL